MRIICIEEHALDPDIAKAAQPALQLEAPYIGLPNPVPRPRLADRPSTVTMKEAVALGADIGQGRIQAMDDYGIQMQIVSWVSPAQLVPADQPVSLTQAANDRLAAAIRANPATSRRVRDDGLPGTHMDSLERTASIPSHHHAVFLPHGVLRIQQSTACARMTMADRLGGQPGEVSEKTQIGYSARVGHICLLLE